MLFRSEEAVATRDPSRPVFGQPPAGDDAVDVRMVEKRLCPGVQDGQEADLSAKTLRVEGDLGQCLGGRGEEQGIGDAWVGTKDGMQDIGNGDDGVVVLDRKQISLTCLNPSKFGQALALGTASVPTGVVGDFLMRASIAVQEVTTEQGGSAAGDCRQGSPLLGGQ